MCSEGRNRTPDLQVMSLVSYHCSTSLSILVSVASARAACELNHVFTEAHESIILPQTELAVHASFLTIFVCHKDFSFCLYRFLYSGNSGSLCHATTRLYELL